MRILRGRATALSADRDATETLVERTRGTGEPGVRVWRPPKNVAFGRRDANREGYERAREIATSRGYPVAERSVGGHAVAFTGTTVAFALAEPVEDSRSGITDRYDRVTHLVSSAMDALGVDVESGEPDGAFCPGTHSLSADGKIVGLAQRVHSDVAVTSGIVVVRDHQEIASALDPIYDALDVPFDRDAVGSISRAGGKSEPETVIETFVDHLTDGESRTVETVEDVSSL